MKVRELIKELEEYNPEAETSVVVHNVLEEFSICYCGPEGVTKENCEDVSFYVDRLCSNEKGDSK